MIRLMKPGHSVEARTLLHNMGITEEIPLVEFTRIKSSTVTEIVSNERQTQLLRGSIPLAQGEISFSPEGLLEVNGIKSCAYILKQPFEKVNLPSRSSSYRYHLCNCTTLQEMQRQGRSSRYVATSRDDGLFEVIVEEVGKYPDFRLSLCQNCKKTLSENGRYFQPFTLAEYYRRYRSDIPSHVKRSRLVEHIEHYRPDHDEVSRRYRKEVGYRCQCCRVCCEEKKHLLHLHHKNGDGQDNSHGNLAVLCALCHSEQPLHGRMQVSREHRDDIHRLRQEQGIRTLLVAKA